MGRTQPFDAPLSQLGHSCLLCGGHGEKPVFPFRTDWGGKTFTYVECSTCHSAFVSPTPTPEDFELMYSFDEYHAEHYAEVPASSYDSSVNFLFESCPQIRTLLDFGCGTGHFLKSVAGRGVQAHGVELHASAVARVAAATGLPVSSLADLEATTAKYDVVHLGDVLEHVPDPAATLQRLARVLTENGCFFIEGPLEKNLSLVRTVATSIKRISRKVGRSNIGSVPPFHLTFTSAASQRFFFERVLGYKVQRFDVSESGWPYSSIDTADRSVGARIRRLVGAAAIEASRANMILPTQWQLANRFQAIVLPR